MAEEVENKGIEQEMGAETSKPTEQTTQEAVAPETEKTTEIPDSEDISDVISVLNIVDSEIGGKGEIKGIPEELRGIMKYMVEKMTFLRDLFQDEAWKAILDDMADQKEDGKTPSVEVAVARTIPLAKLQELADSEDYEGVQAELAAVIEAKKTAADEEAMYEENFNASQKAGDEYAAEMGYSEEEKNALFQLAMDLFKIMGDGKLTKDEWSKVDKMRTFDSMKDDLMGQISKQDAKEVLPDKSSVEGMQKPKPKPTVQSNQPGLGSMSAYMNPTTDITAVKGQNRRNRSM